MITIEEKKDKVREALQKKLGDLQAMLEQALLEGFDDQVHEELGISWNDYEEVIEVYEPAIIMKKR